MAPEADAWIASLLTGRVCFDTMIVRYICAAGGEEALALAFGGRMCLPEAVHTELTLQSARIPGLRAFLARGCHDVEEFDEEADDDIEDIRLDMRKRRAVRKSDIDNLGEAQALFVCDRDNLPLVTHDNKARDRARAEDPPIEVFQITDVLLAMVRLGLRRPAQAWDIYARANADWGMWELLGFPIPGSRDRFITDAANLRAIFLREQETAAGSAAEAEVDDSPPKA